MNFSVGASTIFQNTRRFWIEKFHSRSLVLILGSCLILLSLLIDRGSLIFNNNPPSGADPGNWLTFAWELGGMHIRLAEWAYPPLFPILLRLALNGFEPMTALKVMGFLSWALVGIAFFISLSIFFKNLSFLIRFGLSIFIMLSGYQGEIFAWGGYPQLLGFAFLLLAVPFADDWVQNGGRLYAIFSCIFISGVIYSHHLVAFVLMVMLFFVFLWRLIPSTSRSDLWQKCRRMLILTAGSTILSIGALPFYINYFRYLDANPTNPGGFSFSTISLVITYVYRDLAVFWLILIAVGFIIILINRRHPVNHTVTIFLFVPILLFLLTWEVRILQLTYAGVSYGMALAFSLPQGKKEEMIHQIYKGLHYIILCGFLVLTIPNADTWFVNAQNYYRVVDSDTYEGLKWIKTTAPANDTVLASAWQPFNIGWWIEGYTEHPTIYATDLRWLVFRKERLYASLANHFFNKTSSLAEMKTIINENHVSLIFMDKTIPGQAEEEGKLLKLPHIQKAFENSRIVIFQIR